MRPRREIGSATGLGSFDAIIRFCQRHPGVSTTLGLGVICLIIFGDVLLAPGDLVLSRLGTDVSLQFAHWRAFGFSRIRAGDLPLWNPHVCSGATYVGAFQSSLFYPPVWVHYLLDPAKGINVEFTGHLLLLGSGMYLWASRACVSRAAPFIGAVVAMFCAPIYLRVFAGHLTMLSAIAWIPFVMLSVDLLFDRRPLRGLFGGMCAVGLQILAGHPQTVYYTGLASMAYLGIRLAEARGGFGNIVRWGLMYVGGVLMSAVQLLPGLAAGSASSRGGGGLDYEGATFFSFPPENLLTAVTPWFFGSDMPDLHENTMYWGRGFFWEMNMYSGVGALLLACFAFGHERKVRVIGGVMVAAFSLVVAFGGNTPLYRLFYSLVPGVSHFRGPCKALVIHSVFIAYLVSLGTDVLVRRPVRSALPGLIPIALSLPMFVTAALFYFDRGAEGGSWIAPLISLARNSGESMAGPEIYNDPNFPSGASFCAGGGLFIAALVLACCGSLLRVARRKDGCKWGVPVIVGLECVAFAQLARPAWNISDALNNLMLTDFRTEAEGDYRIMLSRADANSAMSVGMYNISGYDPQVDQEYNDFLGQLPELRPPVAAKWLAMLRCRYLFNQTRDGMRVSDTGLSLDRACLISDVRIIADQRMTYAVMAEAAFNPAYTVILDRTPEPAPAPGATGKATLIGETTDTLEFSVTLDGPAVLLVTDSFARGWKAWSVDDTGKRSEHDIIRANRILRGIPLPAGARTLHLEYKPVEYVIGFWLSLVSVPALFGAYIVLSRRDHAEVGGDVGEAEGAGGA